MLSGVGISHEFWLEAFDTTCYLVNSSLLMDLIEKTPYEAWTRKNAPFSHLRVFGCDAFVHVSKDNNNNKKLDNKYEKCMFIRCKDGVKGYKLWSVVRTTKICSRCVIFIEFEGTSKIEEDKREKEPKYLEFKWNTKSHDSNELTESDKKVEQKTSVIGRSSREKIQLERYNTPY